MTHATNNIQDPSTKEALSRLIAKQPFFAVLAFDLMEISETSDIATAATDGKRLMINPQWFSTLSIEERVFVLAHEIMHAVYSHCERGAKYQRLGFGPNGAKYQHSLHNQAADYVINATLIESKIGKMPKGGLYEPRFTSELLVDDVYVTLAGERPEPQDDDEDEGEQGHGGFDQHLAPESPQSQVEQEQAEQQVKESLHKARETAKAQGTGVPDALDRAVDRLLDGEAADWREILRDVVGTATAGEVHSWKKLNRRSLVRPHPLMQSSRLGGCGTIAVTIDCSGSVADKEMAEFQVEMDAIMSECRPENVVVIWCSNKIHKIDWLEETSDIYELQAPRGGGTDLRHAFVWLEDNDIVPDAHVVLTDGYTAYPEETDYKTCWALNQPAREGSRYYPPFGEITQIALD